MVAMAGENYSSWIKGRCIILIMKRKIRILSLFAAVSL
jgi:hypothetical protein